MVAIACIITFEKLGFHCIHMYSTVYIQAQIQQMLTRQALQEYIGM